MKEVKSTSTRLGRPKKTESEKAKFRFKSFYFPLRFDYIWKEFDELCQKRLELGKLPLHKNKCKSIVIRRLIFKYILEHSLNDRVKKDIKEFIDIEDDKNKIMIDKFLNKGIR